MSADYAQINNWFNRGLADGARYLIVVAFQFGPDEPFWADSAEEAHELIASFEGKLVYAVQEVYDLQLSQMHQLLEPRAWHLPQLWEVA
jgi:hypothetical protein